MEMVWQQAVGKGIRDRLDVLSIELQEVAIVAFLHENALSVVATVVDMIVLTVL
jgi:hypothetical protein